MKKTILENATILGGQVLLFEAPHLVEGVVLTRKHDHILSDDPKILFNMGCHSKDEVVILNKYLVRPDNRGILHDHPLGQEFLANSWYFKKIYETAHQQGFDHSKTFVYEYPGEERFNLFPVAIDDFNAKLNSGTLDLETYEKLFKTSAHKRNIEEYFVKMRRQNNVLKIWNWLEQKPTTSEFQKQTIASLREYNKFNLKT